jgi:hypothetical protein
LLTEPDVAVIVAVPLPFEVTRPADETVATPVFDDDHVTVAPEIADPPGSFTVAANVAVSAKDAKLRLVGDNVTLAAILFLIGFEVWLVVPSPS